MDNRDKIQRLITLLMIVVYVSPACALSHEELLAASLSRFHNIVIGEVTSVTTTVEFEKNGATVHGFGHLLIRKTISGTPSQSYFPLQFSSFTDDQTDWQSSVDDITGERLWLLNQGYNASFTAERAIRCGYPLQNSNYFGAHYPSSLEALCHQLALERPLGIRVLRFPIVDGYPISIEIFVRNSTATNLTIPAIQSSNGVLRCSPSVKVTLEDSNKRTYRLSDVGVLDSKEILIIKPDTTYTVSFDLRNHAIIMPDTGYKLAWEIPGFPASSEETIYSTTEYDPKLLRLLRD